MTTEIKPRAVYKLVRTDKPEDGTDVYVGSTSLSLKTRLQYHRGAAKVSNGNKFYTRMLEIGVYKWQILPLVIHKCDQKEIRNLEQGWIEMLKPDLNCYLSIREDNEKTEKGRKTSKDYQCVILETKRYYCNVCDKTFCHILNLKRHFKSKKHEDKNFEQLIENMHKMIQNGTFSQALENSKETYL